MKKTLGIDLGTNSLGWAILDDITLDVLDKGVLVFPEGIDAAKDNDPQATPAAIRRRARMARRMKFRRKIRKWKLLEELIKNGMCPMTSEELDAWEKSGVYPVGNKAFIDWLKSSVTKNPYADRAAAASGKVSPLVLGRALYHIAQRRGFKSSRKDVLAEGVEDKDLGRVKSDIVALTNEIAAAGCRTLGQYFAKRIADEKGLIVKTRIRKRYTGRVEHYMTEFVAIMEAQGIDHDSDLYQCLYKAIFLQRPLRSQKHLVGSCPLEPRCHRAQISHPTVEEFRMRAFVNNLSFEKANGEIVPLTMKEKELACEAFDKESPRMKFSAISKLFKKKLKEESLKFHYYNTDEQLSTSFIRCKLKNAFGDIQYDKQKVFDALTFFNDDEKLAQWFNKHYPTLSEDSVKKLVAVHPKEGNAQYSLKAINKILPFLRKGHDLFMARFLAKMPDIIPDFKKHEEEIVLHIKEMEAKCRAAHDEMRSDTFRSKEKPPRFMDLCRDYFLTEWNVQDDDWNKLYLHGDSSYNPKRSVRIPEVNLGMMRNPLVQRSLTTLRRFVNYLRDHGKIDAETTIRIELARGVNDYATRHAIQEWQKNREAEREKARMALVALGTQASEDAIERYILWEEQGRKCLYTDKSISLRELLDGNSFDIEHTIPRSKSGDDSMANKTLCDAVYNRQVKKGNIPSECPNFESEIYTNLAPWRQKVDELEKLYLSRKNKARTQNNPKDRANARSAALRTKIELDYWRNKLRRFEISSDKLIDPSYELSSFKRRQLVDTGIMCSHAVALLRSVYSKVYAVNGAATAFARKAWGIQVDDVKDRTEHTHHAKDAMVIAALTPKRFNAICTYLKDDGRNTSMRPCDICKPPCDGFAEKVRKATDEILVKHVMRQTTMRQSSKQNALAKAHPQKDNPDKIVKFVKSQGDTVRGQLHNDTFYGCIATPDTGDTAYVVRKPLDGPIAKIEEFADKIVDPAIRCIVRSALGEFKRDGIKVLSPGMIRMPSGMPVNKVRIFAKDVKNPWKLRNHAMESKHDYKNPYYVKSSDGSNFRLGIFLVNGKMTVQPENILDWAQNHKRSDYVPQDRQEGFVGYIYPGSMALATEDGSTESIRALDAKQLSKRLYKVVKFNGTGRITFRRHVEARTSVVLANDLVAIGKHKNGESNVNFVSPHELLYLSPRGYCKTMLFEGIHFKMALDGSIMFLK